MRTADQLHDGTAPAPEPTADSPYWQFYEAVAAAQLAAWLPTETGLVLDLSGGRAEFAEQLVAAGHDVVHVNGEASTQGPGRALPVVADGRRLSWLADQSVDAVLAEGHALSLCLAAEVAVEDLLRVLRPGGRLLLVVDSLLLGLARLAGQGRWAELADVPAADVVLVPGPDGSITRCFWPAELRDLLTTAGFHVEWVRPRSVLSCSAVEKALAANGGALRSLVTAELALAQQREGESTGLHLVVSAVRPT